MIYRIYELNLKWKNNKRKKIFYGEIIYFLNECCYYYYNYYLYFYYILLTKEVKKKGNINIIKLNYSLCYLIIDKKNINLIYKISSEGKLLIYIYL